MRRLALVPAFFGLRVACGLVLLKLSASFLPVSGFTVFSQFMLFSALLNLVAIGGAQNGLVRQAAAASAPDQLAGAQGAAFLIWLAAAPLLGLPIAAASGAISHVLAGEPGRWPVAIAVAFLALAGGPGQIWCSILSGRKRVASSLCAQASGLLAGTAGAAWMIRRGEPGLAVIAFAAGGLVTMAAAWVFVRRLRIPFASLSAARREAPALLRYSAALAATTGLTSVLLFALRAHYRGAFGPTELGYWMAANRISDMSTQLLGLFMIQVFVPHLAMTRGEAARRALILRCCAAGAAAMAGALAAFSLGARPLVHLFLSDAYLPAIPLIRAYMTGDILRVWPSLAMYAAFAAGRPARYAAIEIATLSLMAGITLALVSMRQADAPALGYAGAYAAAAVLTAVVFFWRRGLVEKLA